MILAVECIIVSIIFMIAIVTATIHNKINWLTEYSPEVQKRFLEKNPQYADKLKDVRKNAGKIKKLLGCILFLIILTVLVLLAGAESFLTGSLYCYIIWFTVNAADVFILDLGVLAHWKKVRLPGTEDMDREYAQNASKSIKDGFKGIIMGIPIAFICGLLTMLITK